MSDESGDADLRLTQLIDHVLEAMRTAEAVEAKALAERFGLPQEEIESYLRGLKALNALGSDGPGATSAPPR